MSRIRKRSAVSCLCFLLSLTLLTLLPFLSGVSYSDRTETPDHLLVFKGDSLVWADGVPDIRESGAYELSLFDSLPVNANGQHMIAPGDEGTSIVRISNDTDTTARYTAVLYRISRDSVPVRADFTGHAPSDTTDTYTLPEGVADECVLRAVSGSIDRFGIADLDIRWIWDFHTDALQDYLDTAIAEGDDADVTVGIYITVEGTDAAPILPSPATGDLLPSLDITLILVLFILILLILMAFVFST